MTDRLKYEDGDYQKHAVYSAVGLAKTIEEQLPQDFFLEDATSILVTAACESFVFAVMIAIEGMKGRGGFDASDRARIDVASGMRKEMLDDVMPLIGEWFRRFAER